MQEYVGVDGCRAGWYAVGLDMAGSWRFDAFPDFTAVWDNYRETSVILVDIPIGLIASGPDGRLCDTIARRTLGPGRASSIFTPPARPVLDAPDYQAALALSKRLTGKGISIQSWNIAPKIRQVDRFLRDNQKARRKVREIHPELLFWALNGRQAMALRKRRLNGYQERLSVLRRHFAAADTITEEALARFRRKEVARDDILDALAAAVTGYLSQGQLSTIPAGAPTDDQGLAMEMVYYLTGH